MKHSIFLLSFFSLIFISNKTLAQGETAVPFLTFPISPATTGMGVTGASLPSDDPYGFLLNPAQLGNISQTTNLSFALYPGSSKLWGFDAYTFNSLALNLGYNFKDDLNFPLSIGLGYSRSSFSFGDYWDQDDVYSSLSFGVGIDYYLQFNAGISIKNISSIFNYRPTSQEFMDAKASINAFDFGLLINVPILELIDKEMHFDLFENHPLSPFLNFSTGYSQLNNGDEIYYIEPSQADPLPRLAKLGYGLSMGFNLELEKQTLKALGFDFTVDAEDLLLQYRIESDSLFPVMSRDGYQSFIGDINLGRNIFSVKGDDNVVSKVGFEIELFEIFSYRQGHLSGRGLNNVKTNGFEIKSDGILKLISQPQEESAINYLSNHFALRFSYSNYSLDENLDTDYYGLSLFVKDFNSLF